MAIIGLIIQTWSSWAQMLSPVALRSLACALISESLLFRRQLGKSVYFASILILIVLNNIRDNCQDRTLGLKIRAMTLIRSVPRISYVYIVFQVIVINISEMEQLQSSCEDSRISQLISFSLSEATRIYSYHREFHFAHDTSFATQTEIEGLYQNLLPQLHQDLIGQKNALIEIEALAQSIIIFIIANEIINLSFFNIIQSVDSDLKPSISDPFPSLFFTLDSKLSALDLLLQSAAPLLATPLSQNALYHQAFGHRSDIKKIAREITNLHILEVKATTSSNASHKYGYFGLIVICFGTDEGRLAKGGFEEIVQNAEMYKEFKEQYFKGPVEQEAFIEKLENIICFISVQSVFVDLNLTNSSIIDTNNFEPEWEKLSALEKILKEFPVYMRNKSTGRLNIETKAPLLDSLAKIIPQIQLRQDEIDKNFGHLLNFLWNSEII